MDEKDDSVSLNELQSKLKQKYPELTDADLQLNHSGKNAMLLVVAYKLHKTKNEMLRIIRLL